MISPAFAFGLALSILFGAAAHALTGGGGRRLLFALAASCLGYVIGESLGRVIIGETMSGVTHVLPGAIGAWIALVALGILARRKWQDGT